jgi:tetratricopeptide (TPR) repeat protein
MRPLAGGAGCAMMAVMTFAARLLNLCRTGACALALALPLPLAAQQDVTAMSLPELLEQLARPDLENWQVVERRILREWGRTGSPTLDLLMRRGRAALQAGDSAAATEHFTAAIERAPDFAEGWHARATAHYAAGLIGPALDDLRTALDLNPQHFGALSGLGVILDEVGNHRAALAVFEAAAAIHPHQPDIETALRRLDRIVNGPAL